MQPNNIAAVDKTSTTAHGMSATREGSLAVVDVAQTNTKSRATSTEHAATKISISVELTSSCIAHSSKITVTKIMQKEIICRQQHKNEKTKKINENNSNKKHRVKLRPSLTE